MIEYKTYIVKSSYGDYLNSSRMVDVNEEEEWFNKYLTILTKERK